MTVECRASIKEKSDVICVSGFYNPSQQERFCLLEQEVVSRYKFDICQVGCSSSFAKGSSPSRRTSATCLPVGRSPRKWKSKSAECRTLSWNSTRFAPP